MNFKNNLSIPYIIANKCPENCDLSESYLQWYTVKESRPQYLNFKSKKNYFPTLKNLFSSSNIMSRKESFNLIRQLNLK